MKITSRLICLIAFLSTASSEALAQTENRLRARELGIEVGIFQPGKLNAITDVPGVMVGQVTLIEGESIRTGVTAILPHAGNMFQEKVPAAIIVGNGFGKLVGSTQVNELGQLETPIILTNTLSVWDAAKAVVEYTLAQPGNEKVRSVNPVVGETNDGFLNDIRGFHVKKEHVLDALHSATSGPVAEGSVGAGTGTVCFGWKGGIGTSSRVVAQKFGGCTVGVLVQTNYGGILQMAGVPLGKELGRYYLKDESRYGAKDSSSEKGLRPPEGSCMIVVALDAPVDARQLQRIAKRALLALGITGSSMSHGSGDYVIAFSAKRITKPTEDSLRLQLGARLHDEDLSPVFQAVVEATEEAIYNSLLKATTISGVDGHTVEVLPIEKVREILKKHGRIRQH